MSHHNIKLVLKLSILGLCLALGYIFIALPNVMTLKQNSMQVPLKVYTADGDLIAEFGDKRRTPVPLKLVPSQMINAIVATEDSRFYRHYGVDIKAILRAVVSLVTSGKKQQGGSTITMQVARNFYLTKQKTFSRKIKEILLAIKIEMFLTKPEILELYLNKIYFGKRAYGIAAAAKTYYGKPINKLHLSQMAMIAGLPQAPSVLNPIKNPQAAKKRRTHVLKRMLHLGFINDEEFNNANNDTIETSYHHPTVKLHAPYVAEAVRQQMLKRFGESAYTRGITVYTSIDSKLQQHANKILKQHVIAYDKRHGWRGYQHHDLTPYLSDEVPTEQSLLIADKYLAYSDIEKILGPHKYLDAKAALVVNVNSDEVEIYVAQQQLKINPNKQQWRDKKRRKLKLLDSFKIGDIVFVQPENGEWKLVQKPEVNAALIAQHPKSGAILALIGGFADDSNSFNRATSAQRQFGSTIKPFIYAAALENGLNAATIINDAPLVITGKHELWRPKNDNYTFLGPTRLRVGLAKSRNLVSIRVLQKIGIPTAIAYLKRFGFPEKSLPHDLTLALGSATTTPELINNAYCQLANGGYKVAPNLITKIYDKQQGLIYQHQISTTTERVLRPETVYLINSFLQDTIKYGTAKKAQILGRQDLAGKTGSTNDNIDAWFSGFHQDLAVTTWLGFDNPKSLQEFPRTTALPLWIDFMQLALQDLKEKLPIMPANLITKKVNPSTGKIDNSSTAIYEYFFKDTKFKINQNSNHETAEVNFEQQLF